MFFALPEGRKSIENRPKIVSKSILNEESKRAPKNSPKMIQNGSKIDPSWGHLGLQNRLGGVQERRKNDTQDENEKLSEKAHEGLPPAAPTGPESGRRRPPRRAFSKGKDQRVRQDLQKTLQRT